MLETMTPYFSVLPFRAALFISMLGPIPAVVTVARSRKKPATTAQTAFSAFSILIGAWACLNLLTSLMAI